ncbi:hypothetical protein HBH89_239070 [Parastagonospora nodorum]|nr:hypothetical protein HBH89_239070 [Parastagonospora nodorum]KAH6287516.1 hypothetical protein HBI40_107310 [Parastagonospora nodorum]
MRARRFSLHLSSGDKYHRYGDDPVHTQTHPVRDKTRNRAAELPHAAHQSGTVSGPLSFSALISPFGRSDTTGCKCPKDRQCCAYAQPRFKDQCSTGGIQLHRCACDHGCVLRGVLDARPSDANFGAIGRCADTDYAGVRADACGEGF